METTRGSMGTAIKAAPRVLAALALILAQACATRPPASPGLTDAGALVADLERRRDEMLEGNRERYSRWSAPVEAALSAKWEGEWWVIAFRGEGRPGWVRGAARGEPELADEASAVRMSEALLEGIGDIFLCRGKSFDAPRVLEDEWTWRVELPQTAGGVPVDEASLRFRLFKRYTPEDRIRGQWNVEVVDMTWDLPDGFDPRPTVAPDGVDAVLRAAGVPEEDLAGAPRLVVRRVGEGEGRAVLCWEVKGVNGNYLVDAATGEYLGARDRFVPLER